MALSASCQEGEAELPSEGQRIAKHELLSVVQEEKVIVFPPFLCFMAWGWWLTISGPE